MFTFPFALNIWLTTYYQCISSKAPPWSRLHLAHRPSGIAISNGECLSLRRNSNNVTLFVSDRLKPAKPPVRRRECQLVRLRKTLSLHLPFRSLKCSFTTPSSISPTKAWQKPPRLPCALVAVERNRKTHLLICLLRTNVEIWLFPKTHRSSDHNIHKH